MKQPRLHHKGFLSALHDLPCLRCGSRPVEAAHIRMINLEWEEKTGVRTGAGMAEKPSDMWSMPLCSGCHRTGKGAEHNVGTENFYRTWGVDPHAIAFALFTAYPDRGRMASVAINVQLGGYRL